jgi:hypothetical protein
VTLSLKRQATNQFFTVSLPRYIVRASVQMFNYIVINTDKKENKVFLIFKEIQIGAVAKSYMRKGFLIYEEIRKYFPIYEEVSLI